LPQLDAQQRLSMAGYLSMVDQYRKVLNLTAFRGYDELLFELVIESARLLQLGPIAPGSKCLDLGSGVGTPVVPLAVLCPAANFIAVESRERRASFLRLVGAQLKLTNLTVLQQHSSDFGLEHALAYDLVTARAFAKLDTLFAAALPLLKPEGEIRAYLGAEQDLDPALLDRLGLRLRQRIEYEARGARRSIYAVARHIIGHLT
jgi:16S rRNA (guanine527-N7)-methyltransferase